MDQDFHLAAVSPLIHFETCSKVQNATTKKLETPRANVLQRRMAEAIEVLTALEVPAIRIIVTKIRQCGGTTFSVEVIYHLCQQRNTDALILANIAANSQGILERMRTFSENDSFPWHNPLTPQAVNMRWRNGSTATITSAESMNPGISKPRQAVLFSESAKYPRGGVKDDKKIFASILPSLNDAGLAIAESTPDGACYDGETEVLTDEGWKLFSSLTGKESILTKDPVSDVAYYQKEWTHQVHHHKGDMIRISSRILDLLVTPNHKLWVACSRGPMRFREADKIAASTGDYYFDRSFKWERPDVEYFTLPAHSFKKWNKTHHREARRIPMNIWLRFLGHFLSEGHVTYGNTKGKYGKSTNITQVLFIPLFDEVVESMRPYISGSIRKKKHNNGVRWTLYDCQLATYLHSISKPKRIPRDLLMSLSQDQCRLLLASIYEGDGDQYKARATSYQCGKVYTGIDTPLTNDTQELALKAGFSCNIGGGARNQTVSYRDCKRAKLTYANSATTEPGYDGLVYCVSLPKDHLLMVRRHGKTTWCGNSGAHFDLWQKAITLDEFISQWTKGNTSPGNGWVKIFAAWFEFEDNTKEINDAMRQQINETLSPREANGRLKYKWTDEQIAWRRAIMAAECNSSESSFDEFYPEDEISCFLSSGRPRFNVASIQKLSKNATLHSPEIGSLVAIGDGVSFQRDPTGFGSFQIWEQPKAGCSYIVWCDPMTGEDQTESNDPDRHSIGVLRAQYDEQGGACYKEAVVARVRPPFTGTTMLTADYIVLLSEYYGGALVVLEINMGLHVLERLKDAGVPLYKRLVVDPFDREKQTFMDGWKLKDRDQRREVIDSLALAFHNEQLDVFCLHIIKECQSFVWNKNGREEARSGCHDDDVLGLAMAHRCIGSATMYKPYVRRRRRPQDYRKTWS